MQHALSHTFSMLSSVTVPYTGNPQLNVASKGQRSRLTSSRALRYRDWTMAMCSAVKYSTVRRQRNLSAVGVAVLQGFLTSVTFLHLLDLFFLDSLCSKS